MLMRKSVFFSPGRTLLNGSSTLTSRNASTLLAMSGFSKTRPWKKVCCAPGFGLDSWKVENSSLRKLALHRVGSYPPLYRITLSMVFKTSFSNDSLVGFRKGKGQRERVIHPA
jgi:hypothetical protein